MAVTRLAQVDSSDTAVETTDWMLDHADSGLV